MLILNSLAKFSQSGMLSGNCSSNFSLILCKIIREGAHRAGSLLPIPAVRTQTSTHGETPCSLGGGMHCVLLFPAGVATHWGIGLLTLRRC